jgi:Domain of unknown function (DUF4112)
LVLYDIKLLIEFLGFIQIFTGIIKNMKNIKQLERWAWLLDNSIRIPGTSIKMGLDSLIGLIPGIGDITGGALSSYILLQAVSTGVALLLLLLAWL